MGKKKKGCSRPKKRVKFKVLVVFSDNCRIKFEDTNGALDYIAKNEFEEDVVEVFVVENGELVAYELEETRICKLVKV